MPKKKIQAASYRFAFKDILFLIGGAISAAFGLRGFLLPNHFLDGGVVGISLIVENVMRWPLPPLLILFNAPFIVLGWFQVSRYFALKTLFAITLLALLVAFLPIDAVTAEPVLIAVFGGFFVGLGIGLAIRGGGVIDGTEVLALWLSRHTPFTVGDFIILINIIIFCVASQIFSLNIALYAMLTYLCAARTVDTVLHGIEQYVALQIFSTKSVSIIHTVLTRSMKLNVTVIPAQKGDPSRPDRATSQPILYTVVSRLEMQNIINTVHHIDQNALVIHHKITDMERGGHRM